MAAPGIVDEFEELSAELVKTSPDDDPLIHGAMLYRLGRYRESADTLARCVDASVEPENEVFLEEQCCARYFLAMARQQQSQTFQAKRLLEEARIQGQAIGSRPDLLWRWRVELDALRREAIALIDP